MKKIAVIGDIHACYLELEELYNKLCWLSLDEIISVGDVIDRGMHSGKTIDFLIEKNIKTILGNHETSIINHYKSYLKNKTLPRNKDFQKTILELSPHHLTWMENLNPLYINDNLGLVIVHGGIFPNTEWYKQPHNICRAQLINPLYPGQTKWFDKDFDDILEEENYKLGWRRWYHLYDHEYDVIFGHSTFYQPMIYQKDYGKCIGIDCGSSFGGSLTACIYDESKEPWFISVKNKKVYYESTTRSFWEA